MVQVVPCLAIFDTMKYINSDVGTVGFGGCMGMSGFLLAVGKKASVSRPTALHRIGLC
jgi:ATP-dependent protease ClpP protease subunit